jgi:hypothetical protein
MRMWMVDPRLMCRKHLLGEHVEIHMLVGTLQRRKTISGFIQRGLLQPEAIYLRHDALVDEMTARGYRHRSPLDSVCMDYLPPAERAGTVNPAVALADLQGRCPDCAKLADGQDSSF